MWFMKLIRRQRLFNAYLEEAGRLPISTSVNASYAYARGELSRDQLARILRACL